MCCLVQCGRIHLLSFVRLQILSIPQATLLWFTVALSCNKNNIKNQSINNNFNIKKNIKTKQKTQQHTHLSLIVCKNTCWTILSFLVSSGSDSHRRNQEEANSGCTHSSKWLLETQEKRWPALIQEASHGTFPLKMYLFQDVCGHFLSCSFPSERLKNLG